MFPATRITPLSCVTLILVVTAGCGSLRDWKANGYQLGPNYRRPVVNVADQWIDSNHESVATTHDEQADWWRVFNDPTLEHLVNAAFQQNLSVRTAGLRVIEARTQRDITTLNLLPQSQNASGSYARNTISLNAANSFPGVNRNFSDWRSGFDLSWELDVWGRIRRSIEASDAVLEAEVETYDDILVTLIGDVAASYIELRAFDERLQLAEKNVEILLASLDIADALYQEEETTELDVKQATSNVADTKALVSQLRQGRRLVVNRLALLLGMSPYELEPHLQIRGALPVTPQQAIVGIPAGLLRRRPDVRAAERAVAARSAQIGIAEAELYPQFGISGEIGLNTERFSKLFNASSINGFIAPGFSWKILNYGRLRRGVRVSQLQFQQSVMDYENVVLAAQREVEDAMIQYLESKERVEHLRTSADAAADSVELVRVQYTEGEVDFGRVFVLESLLVQRQDQLVATKAEVAVALIRLYKALGGGWQLRLGTRYCGRYPVESIGYPMMQVDNEANVSSTAINSDESEDSSESVEGDERSEGDDRSESGDQSEGGEGSESSEREEGGENNEGGRTRDILSAIEGGEEEPTGGMDKDADVDQAVESLKNLFESER